MFSWGSEYGINGEHLHCCCIHFLSLITVDMGPMACYHAMVFNSAVLSGRTTHVFEAWGICLEVYFHHGPPDKISTCMRAQANSWWPTVQRLSTCVAWLALESGVESGALLGFFCKIWIGAICVAWIGIEL